MTNRSRTIIISAKCVEYLDFGEVYILVRESTTVLLELYNNFLEYKVSIV
jgi:hypothetical protein